jgi:ABC-type glycerol-3-phosphate transport system substrate-binding protein
MAKDGSYKAPSATAPIDQDEEFFNSAMGQDITRLFDEFSSGKKTFDEAADEFNAKWGQELAGPNQSAPLKQTPNTPYVPVR